MNRWGRPITILMAEDDKDDQLLVRDSFDECHLVNELLFVEDGQQLIDYLKRRPPYNDEEKAPFPDIILLDLNMPRKDGREALEEIKRDPELKHIPVIVLTTSKAEEDILRSYKLGVAGFISKPVTFNGLVQVVRTLTDYWFQIVKLPPKLV
ncbi:response regulator [Caldithrix abyssi]|uniref:Response regulator receiver domain-containing protein n=1 Tax=Caldithrix abyssi DSM 13497 TaxID=880073 RepID=H1XSZ0_CALAY|nr:response regulator [Caldithrix abyssi]APF17298.1 Response regulator receiver domain-containing protein [Caldithrix abyssi DSM 13497]EHO41419.1 response regulator receiver protein [Caldithrix abyssi DSM 13497]